MHKILVIRLHYLLDALHVLNNLSPSSGATFIICTSYLVYAGTIRPAYTKYDIQLIKVAPDDGLMQSETCRASNRK